MKVILPFLIATSMITACGDDKIETAQYGVVGSEATACVQGVVTNGLDGTRVNLDTSRIYVVVNGKAVSDNYKLTKNDSSVSALGLDQGDVEGEYSFCGLPSAITTSFPLVAKVDGYQTLETTIKAPGIGPNRNTSTSNPGFWSTPTVIANLSVWKKEDLISQSYVVRIKRLGAPVEGATVRLAQLNAGGTAPGTFSLSAVTDSSGAASFEASGLAFGSSYGVFVTPSAVIDDDGGSISGYGNQGTVVIGSTFNGTASGNIKNTSAFSTDIDIGRTNASPVLVNFSGSGSGGSPVNTNGSLTLEFDRTVSLTASGLSSSAGGATFAITSNGTRTDGTACTLADNGTPVISTDDVKVNFEVSGNTLTASPKWATAPTINSDCKGFTITYTWGSATVYSSTGTNLISLTTLQTEIGSATTAVYMSAP